MYTYWLTSRPKGCLQPRELWFFDILMYMYVRVCIGRWEGRGERAAVSE